MAIAPITKRLHLIATSLVGILLIWELVLFANPDKSTIWNVLFNFGYAKMFLFAGLTALFFGRRNSLAGARGNMMIFLGFAALSFVIALWIWAYYALVLHINAPFPSLADGFFLLYTILFAGGVLCLVRIFSPVITRRQVIESVSLIAILSICFFVWLILPRFDSNHSFLTQFFTFSLPIMDAVILSLLLICLRASGGSSNQYLYLFMVSGFFLVAADYLFLYRQQAGVYWNGDFSDLFYLLSGYALASGIIAAVEETH